MTATATAEALPVETPKPSFPTLMEAGKVLQRLVDRCKSSDGKMPEEVFILVSREELRAVFAANRYLDELGLLREARRR